MGPTLYYVFDGFEAITVVGGGRSEMCSRIFVLDLAPSREPNDILQTHLQWSQSAVQNLGLIAQDSAK